jgi:hypothetical protein
MFPILAGLSTALLLFASIFYITLRTHRKAGYTYLSFRPLKWKVQLDSDEQKLVEEEVEFDARHGHYMKLAEVITSLAAASIAFVPQLHVPYRSVVFAYCLVLLGASVLLCVLFMALLTYFYEASLYVPRTYTARKSALVTALGFGGLGCFALAYLFIACRVGWTIYRGGMDH